MENPLRHFADLDLRRTFVAGCPCQTKTAAAFIERPMMRRQMGAGILPPYSPPMQSMTKVGEGVAIPSKVWTDEDVQKEKTSAAITGATLGAVGGMMLAWWVFK